MASTGDDSLGGGPSTSQPLNDDASHSSGMTDSTVVEIQVRRGRVVTLDSRNRLPRPGERILPASKMLGKIEFPVPVPPQNAVRALDALRRENAELRSKLGEFRKGKEAAEQRMISASREAQTLQRSNASLVSEHQVRPARPARPLTRAGPPPDPPPPTPNHRAPPSPPHAGGHGGPVEAAQGAAGSL